jgi:preprotein translocase subunit SecA
MLKRRGLKYEVLNAKQHQREAEIVAQAGRSGSVTIATNMAGRGTDIKLGPNVKQCQVCGIRSKAAPFGQRIEEPDLTLAEMAAKGCEEDPPCGLVIVGTERHESRRIDRQLRGRSGRQGDPGQSRFFMSLEDDLMRLFATDRVSRWMEKSGAEEGEVITHPWVTKAIESAQKRVEMQNFQVRKRLLDYDDVMNQQREVVYSLRLFALEGGEELKAEALRMIDAAVVQFATQYAATTPEDWDRELIAADLLMKFLMSVPDVKDPEKVPDVEALTVRLKEAGRDAFKTKIMTWDEMSKRYNASDLVEKLLSNVVLQVSDEKWKDHLYDLDQLRTAIQYRAYGQKDPLIEYKQEAFDLFADFMKDVRQSFTERLFKLQVQAPTAPPPGLPRQPARAEPGRSDADLMVPGAARRPVAPPRGLTTSGPSEAGGQRSQRQAAPRSADPKVGRNDPCPCGSGKKYKKCHGAVA